MLSKMHTEYTRWLKAAKELQTQYEAGDDQRAIDAGRKSIARLEKKLKELEEQGACL